MLSPCYIIGKLGEEIVDIYVNSRNNCILTICTSTMSIIIATDVVTITTKYMWNVWQGVARQICTDRSEHECVWSPVGHRLCVVLNGVHFVWILPRLVKPGDGKLISYINALYFIWLVINISIGNLMFSTIRYYGGLWRKYMYDWYIILW